MTKNRFNSIQPAIFGGFKIKRSLSRSCYPGQRIIFFPIERNREDKCWHNNDVRIVAVITVSKEKNLLHRTRFLIKARNEIFFAGDVCNVRKDLASFMRLLLVCQYGFPEVVY